MQFELDQERVNRIISARNTDFGVFLRGIPIRLMSDFRLGRISEMYSKMGWSKCRFVVRIKG